jgi:peptidoglycan/xylan/chitin deacetylase (PgdA/CDA1 family)
MYRWLGWLALAALATTAPALAPAEPRAAQPAAPHARTPDPLPPEAKSAVEPAARVHTQVDRPVNARVGGTHDAAVDGPAGAPAAARVHAKPEAAHDANAGRRKTVATATVPEKPTRLDAKEIKSLTRDPALGKADRIDGNEHPGVVAFTFDDGPNPETTPQVIDALEKYNVPATFFIVTQRITGRHGEHGRELLHRELDAGFLVGSHSVSHTSLKRATGDKLGREIDASIKTLAIEAGRPIGMFRPPYGSLSTAGRVRLKNLGLTEVQWSVDTLDWRAHSAAKLRKKVLAMIMHDGGGVVLMHDVKPITAGVIADVLDDLEAENCTRLAEHREPILPVSLHYFLKDGKAPRAVPDAVLQRTAAYKAALPARCAKRGTVSLLSRFAAPIAGGIPTC